MIPQRFEYKTVVFSVPRKTGFWTHEPESSELADIDAELKRLGSEGWQMVGVFPVTDGGSPAQISQAIHYFMRPVADL